ncbi:shikimate dehydrogenase [Amycolatopsis marina]|uniref:Shikimate dehydrogenase n=1 Tax=Amycolatopsis marina TaxID=490629 RepID=A0A1I0ZAD2_9PSEU|nr:shikimate dehydrogenase [Amycolatopsis marina]SFB22317.1 shikimate dehydrogenase [Amycolatopsis marina]
MPTEPAPAEGRLRAGVVGKPIEHSLSPVLHGAAYRALGLTGWTYDRIEMDAAGLPGFVRDLGPEWAGLSVTMPGKRAALALASEVTARAAAVGAANTLVPCDSGWRADCTDVDGVVGALRSAGGFRGADPGATGVVLGAGGTAAAAAVAFAELGLSGVRLVVREPARAEETSAAAARMGLAVEVLKWSEVEFAELAQAPVVVSTVPSAAVEPHLDDLALAACLLDVIYDPWPTPLARAVAERGGSLGTGLDMLLHQAFGQVEQFTGQQAPRAAMRDALRAATGGTIPLPLG